MRLLLFCFVLIFIWLCLVLVVACGVSFPDRVWTHTFSWKQVVLATGTTGKVPHETFVYFQLYPLSDPSFWACSDHITVYLFKIMNNFKRKIIYYNTLVCCHGSLIDMLVNWLLGFPGSPDDIESACSTGDGFDPCVGKIPYKREWHPNSVFLPGESHGQRSLGATACGIEIESNMTEHADTYSVSS